MDKTVTIILDSGTRGTHVLVVEDDDDYVKKINEFANNLLKSTEKAILGFTTPLCLYKVKNIAAIEFSEPPPENTRLPIGFRQQSESNL